MALLFVFFLSLPSVVTAATAACPVSVTYVSLEATGKPNGMGRYRIGLKLPPKSSFAIRFAINGGSAKASQTAYVSQVTAVSMVFPELTYVWPTTDASELAIQAITDLVANQALTCASNPVAITKPKPDTAMPEFDDTSFGAYPEMMASVVPARLERGRPSFTNKVVPTYPDAVKMLDEGGTVRVAVTLGLDGALLNAYVFSGSGNSLLDDAALKAAEQSTYKAAQVSGELAIATYIVEYTFWLE